MHEFHAYSALHAAALIGIAVVSIVASILRRRAGSAIGRWMDLILTATLVLVALVCHGTRFWSEPFDGLRTLPLHLCHLSSILAPIVRRRSSLSLPQPFPRGSVRILSI